MPGGGWAWQNETPPLDLQVSGNTDNNIVFFEMIESDVFCDSVCIRMYVHVLLYYYSIYVIFTPLLYTEYIGSGPFIDITHTKITEQA